MNRLFTLGITALVFASSPVPAAESEAQEARMEALRELNDFIGQWKSTGEPDKARPAANELWSESLTWAWRFKGDDAWLNVQIKNGKLYKSGDLRFLADKKVYELEMVDKKDNKLLFKGQLKDGFLTLIRDDPKTKETQRIIMNTAGDGVRFIYMVAHKPANRTAYVKDFKVAGNKEGESLGAAQKKIECVVSGGLGKIPVSFKGETFYVCCSGCKDAFDEDPEKYVKKFKAKKK
ncbi:MAG: YHS domain-containing protein [Gemmataceae bacterium]